MYGKTGLRNVFISMTIMSLACSGSGDGDAGSGGAGGVDSGSQPETGVGAAGSPDASAFVLTSTAFDHGGPIPAKYTCNGNDVSPPLSWTGLPSATKSLVLIVDDPDAPDPAAPQTTWVHWVVYDIPPEAGGLGEAVAQLPTGAKEGTNSWGVAGYGGPCPPIGNHRYFHKLYALDTVLPDLGSVDKDGVVEAMQGHVLDDTELLGTYQQP